MAKRVSNIVIENANIIPGFKNFSGRVTRGNPTGKRQFCVELDWELAEKLKNDGWNVKVYTYNPEQFAELSKDGWNVKLKVSEDPDAEPLVFLQVNVRFDKVPPKILMVSKKNEIQIGESEVKDLDEYSFIKTNVIISPYHYETADKSGITAYLHTLYAVIDESPLDRWRSERIDDDDLPF